MSGTKMKRAVLTLGSHSLGNFKQCGYKYYLADIRHLEPVLSYAPYVRGTIVTSLLAEYYWHKIVQEKFDPWEAFERITQKCPHLPDEEKQVIESRFFAYMKFYKNESWVPITVEKSAFADSENEGTGFSKVIYENPHVLFVLEGEPDLIVQLSSRDTRLIIVDTKSQSRKHNLYHYVDQFMGYSWAAEVNTFSLNYFSLISSGKPEDWFRRSTVVFHKSQLEEWKRDTVRWFRKIAVARKNKIFLKSRLCESRYGICPFSEICEQTHDWVREGLIKQKFKKRERTRSW